MSSNKRILVAMSGRVDSAVAAALLKMQGYDVGGVHFQFLPASESTIPLGGGSCCSPSEAENFKQICQKLEIPYYTMNLQEAFYETIVDDLIHEYLQARRPNPCVACNSNFKIHYLLKKADELKYGLVATGHYAKVVRNADGSETNLYKAADHTKDQSYFLSGLKQEELSRLIMPLGELLKNNVRKMAVTFGLPLVNQPSDDQKICFRGNEAATLAFIKKKSPERCRYAGPIVSQDGQVFGRHSGLFRHSTGQQKIMGLDKPEHQDLVVLGSDIRQNALIVGTEKDLYRSGLLAVSCNWIGLQDFSKGIKAKAKIRHDHKEAPCMITLLNNNSALVDFEDPQRAVTCGETVVFYKDDFVIGSGKIESLSEPLSTRLHSKQQAFVAQ